jgi:hypothetical protein
MITTTQWFRIVKFLGFIIQNGTEHNIVQLIQIFNNRGYYIHSMSHNVKHI